jgi:Glycosyl hydrolases family 16
MRPLPALAGLVLLAGCATSGPAAEGADPRVPGLRWRAPGASQPVSGVLTGNECHVVAAGDDRIERVDFTVPGSGLQRDRSRPYACRWDTRRGANGEHVLRAVAYDRSGNRREIARRVVVTNPTEADATRRYADWNLVFSDDFDETALDRHDWAPYDGPGHAGNGLRRPSAVQVRDGALVLTASMAGNALVSGGLEHRRNYRYGLFEFRVRTDPDPSGVTSGEVLTWPKSERWPVDGENDIYETGNSPVRTSFDTYIHFGGDNEQHVFTHYSDPGQWQTMAMEWEPDVIRIYRAGILVWSLRDATAVPDVPHHLCIQLDALATVMSAVARMSVDYVRIYQRA